jgi:gag-polypeptide of LTR copia-type
MNDDSRISVEKIVADGYHGSNGSLTTTECFWAMDVVSKHLSSTSSGSNAMFNKIKGKRNKDILDALKALFEWHATRGLVDLE